MGVYRGFDPHFFIWPHLSLWTSSESPSPILSSTPTMQNYGQVQPDPSTLFVIVRALYHQWRLHMGPNMSKMCKNANSVLTSNLLSTILILFKLWMIIIHALSNFCSWIKIYSVILNHSWLRPWISAFMNLRSLFLRNSTKYSRIQQN